MASKSGDIDVFDNSGLYRRMRVIRNGISLLDDVSTVNDNTTLGSDGGETNNTTIASSDDPFALRQESNRTSDLSRLLRFGTIIDEEEDDKAIVEPEYREQSSGRGGDGKITNTTRALSSSGGSRKTPADDERYFFSNNSSYEDTSFMASPSSSVDNANNINSSSDVLFNGSKNDANSKNILFFHNKNDDEDARNSIARKDEDVSDEYGVTSTRTKKNEYMISLDNGIKLFDNDESFTSSIRSSNKNSNITVDERKSPDSYQDHGTTPQQPTGVNKFNENESHTDNEFWLHNVLYNGLVAARFFLGTCYDQIDEILIRLYNVPKDGQEDECNSLHDNIIRSECNVNTDILTVDIKENNEPILTMLTRQQRHETTKRNNANNQYVHSECRDDDCHCTDRHRDSDEDNNKITESLSDGEISKSESFLRFKEYMFDRYKDDDNNYSEFKDVATSKLSRSTSSNRIVNNRDKRNTFMDAESSSVNS